MNEDPEIDDDVAASVEGDADDAAQNKPESDTAAADQKSDAPAAKPGAASPQGEAGSIPLDLIHSIPVTLKVVLGSVDIPVSTLMSMKRGEVIALERKVGEIVDVLANDQLIGRGEIIVVDGEEPMFGITLTELIGGREIV